MRHPVGHGDLAIQRPGARLRAPSDGSADFARHALTQAGPGAVVEPWLRVLVDALRITRRE